MNFRLLKTVRMEEVKDPTGGGEGAAGGGSDDGTDDKSGGGDGESGDSDKDRDTGKKDDDKGGPSTEEAKLLKEVMQKKERIQALTDREAELQAEVDKFKGIDVDQVRELLAEREKAEVTKLEKKGEWDRLRERMADEHKKEIGALKDQLGLANTSVSEKDATIIELTIGHSFDNSKFVTDDTLLTPRKARIIYGDHFDIENGKVVGYDKPKGDSKRTQLVNGSGASLGFEESLRSIIDGDPDVDSILRSKMKSGAASSSKPADKGPADVGKKSGLDKISAGLKSRTGK